MGQKSFDSSSDSREFEAAIRGSGEDPARMAAIDTGPYLRQEGRQLERHRARDEVRQTALRKRAEQGLATSALAIYRADRVRRLQQANPRPDVWRDGLDFLAGALGSPARMSRLQPDLSADRTSCQ